MFKNVKQLGFFLFLTVITVSLSGCGRDYAKNYVTEDIDDIVYAQPSEEAKNFDLEGYIKSLPEVEYTKIDYPIKETYTYNFNGYSMTIDIPEGFEAYEIPLKEKPQVIDSKGLEDSCFRLYSEGFWCADDDGGRNFFMNALGRSDSSLCIISTDTLSQFDDTQEFCHGMGIHPHKSLFRGVSMREYFYRMNILNGIDDFRRDVKKHTVSDRDYLMGGAFRAPDLSLLLSDDQEVYIDFDSDDKKINPNIYFSIVDSIEIKEN